MPGPGTRQFCIVEISEQPKLQNAHGVYIVDGWVMLHVPCLDLFKRRAVRGGACDNPGIAHGV